MGQSTGSIRFFATSDDEYIDMVGQNYDGLVVVRLEAGLKYVCFGECRVGKVLQLQDSTT